MGSPEWIAKQSTDELKARQAKIKDWQRIDPEFGGSAYGAVPDADKMDWELRLIEAELAVREDPSKAEPGPDPDDPYGYNSKSVDELKARQKQLLEWMLWVPPPTEGEIDEGGPPTPWDSPVDGWTSPTSPSEELDRIDAALSLRTDDPPLPGQAVVDSAKSDWVHKKQAAAAADKQASDAAYRAQDMEAAAGDHALHQAYVDAIRAYNALPPFPAYEEGHRSREWQAALSAWRAMITPAEHQAIDEAGTQAHDLRQAAGQAHVRADEAERAYARLRLELLAEAAGLSPAAPAAPSLDTGHYDDGHSFGWKRPAVVGGLVALIVLALAGVVIAQSGGDAKPDSAAAATTTTTTTTTAPAPAAPPPKVSGPYAGTVKVAKDKAGHSCCVKPATTWEILQVRDTTTNQITINLKGVLPGIDLSSPLGATGDRFTATAKGTVAGFDDVEVTFTGTVTPADGVRGTLTVGGNGKLPKGEPIQFDVALAKP